MSDGVYAHLPSDQISHLAALCVVYLLLSLVNGYFKFLINTRASRLGERVVTTLRSELYRMRLRVPPERRALVTPGRLVAIVSAETDALGGFIGDAIVLPAIQGGTLLVYVAFVFAQEPLLGLGTVALYPLQVLVIPRLQAKINVLSRERIGLLRNVADHIGNTVSTLPEVRGQQRDDADMQTMDAALAKLRETRYEIFRQKFLLKYLNNTISKIVPLLFYSVGGYLTIKGSLSLGALVAVLAAYADMSAPWKELLDYYQQKEDMKTRFQQIAREFGDDSASTKST
jgi:ABC-type multidrug transport system fused ATPase/permease subunit